MPIATHRALRTTVRSLIAALLLLAFGRAGQSEAQALIKVNDNINFKVGLLIQSQLDFQETANAANDASGGYQQNLFIRRLRFLMGGQVAKNLFFFFETENSNLGKSTQAVGSTTGTKSIGTGFNVLDAVGEWRIAKEFNLQFGELRSPVSREGLKSSPNQFMLDLSAYAYHRVLVRFRLISDSNLEHDGWYVDNVHINDANCSPVLAVLPPSAPRTLSFSAPSPNPSFARARFAFELPLHEDRVELAVYDVNGRELRHEQLGPLEPGTHDWVWNGRDRAGRAVDAGVYFARLTVGNRMLTQKATWMTR